MADRPKLSDILRDGADDLASLWRSTTPAADRKPLPAGVHRCRVVEGRLFQARSGSPGYKVTFEVADGEHSGGRVWLDLWLTGRALPMTRRDLAKLGVDDLKQLEEPLPPGGVADVTVVLRKADDGRYYNRVQSFELVAFEPPEPDPFASDSSDAVADSGEVETFEL